MRVSRPWAELGFLAETVIYTNAAYECSSVFLDACNCPCDKPNCAGVVLYQVLPAFLVEEAYVRPIDTKCSPLSDRK